MFTEEDYKIIDKEFDGLRLASLKRCADQQEYELVLKAFDVANEAHRNVRRRSGEPYILHPISVAKIVVSEIGLGCKSICAALLHDVVEDTEHSVEDIRRMFGDKIASLVDGLTKIKTALNENAGSTTIQAENFKRILLTLNDDVRIILIKLADRLHNLRTIEFMPEYKREKILSETMFIFIPLAHRLGLYNIKSEMENIWLKHKEPEIYKSIESQLKKVEAERSTIINNFVDKIHKAIDDAGYKVEIKRRLKTPYSVWRKMNTKQIGFEELYDIYAIRIVFETKKGLTESSQCIEIHTIITQRLKYKIKPDRTRNWLGDNKKTNGYEALHVTVMGEDGKWIEVQIRSERMDSIAERGVAAHWLYKRGEITQNSDQYLDLWLKHIREILENPDTNALQFLDDFHKELLSSDIYVFTPKGEAKTLIKGATALDFAYSIHSHIGNKAIAAKVNQKLAPLSYVLANGDQVEILTSDNSKPKREWLTFLKTNKAKSLVMDAISGDTKDNIKEGMQILDKLLSERNITAKGRVIKKLTEYYNINSGKDDLYNRIGVGVITIDDLTRVLKTNVERRNVQMWGVKLLEPIKNIGRIDKKQEYELKEDLADGTISFNTAECCSPIPGDKVVGFVDDEGMVVIHKKSCPVATDLASKYGNKLIAAKWSKHFAMSYLARISVTGIDRVGVLNELTKVISLMLGVNIRKIMIEKHDEVFEGYIELYVHHADDLNKLMNSVRSIKGIESVKREEINKQQ